jgi:hypothetical protein
MFIVVGSFLHVVIHTDNRRLPFLAWLAFKCALCALLIYCCIGWHFSYLAIAKKFYGVVISSGWIAALSSVWGFMYISFSLVGLSYSVQLLCLLFGISYGCGSNRCYIRSALFTLSTALMGGIPTLDACQAILQTSSSAGEGFAFILAHVVGIVSLAIISACLCIKWSGVRVSDVIPTSVVSGVVRALDFALARLSVGIIVPVTGSVLSPYTRNFFQLWEAIFLWRGFGGFFTNQSSYGSGLDPPRLVGFGLLVSVGI